MSDDNTIELNRRRVLGGVVTIGAAAAAAGAGTFAAFSDTENSTGNQLTAGTLDLTVGDSTPLSFQDSDIKPTDGGKAYASISNAGSIAGDLDITVTSVSASEPNSSDVDDDVDVDGTNGGELADQLDLKLWVEDDNDGSPDSTDDGLASDGNIVDASGMSYSPASDYDGASWTGVFTDWSGSARFYVDWEFPNGTNADDNDAQGETITIDFKFDLTQPTS